MLYHPIPLRSVLTVPAHLRLDLPCGLFPFPKRNSKYMSLRPHTWHIFFYVVQKKRHNKIWYFQDCTLSRVSVGLCSSVLLSAMLLVLTVTHLTVREWGVLRQHNTNTRLHQNSSIDFRDET
jgi:hypothetical protein